MSGVAGRTEQEASWIQRIAGGDRHAFEQLYNAYRRRLFGYLRYRIGDAERAEEVTNDVLIEVWKGARGFQGRSRPSTWIFGIAHHKAMSELRKRRTDKVDLETAQTVADGAEGAEDQLLLEDRWDRVLKAIETLSPEHREVVDLTFFHGFSYPEISEIVKCPVNTVKTRMFYARKRLKEMLEGGVPEGQAI